MSTPPIRWQNTPPRHVKSEPKMVRSEQLEEEEECQKKGMKKSRNQARGKITSTGIINTHAARGSTRNQVSDKAMAEKEDRFTFQKRKLL
ncbi:hypothetical protein H5410_021816 [Solanum commersonii]|uniref:Uncharacterized protein n=1 Tax=Solanum commersonii TaxID=4109 RepID=A0A9J5ZF18_SOLCO|nr:hypothetical protein H5410_021816 [Solanum commersonii]